MRSRVHRFATEVISAAELRDALILAGAALVLLPLLPDRPLAWLAGLNPWRIWSLAVLLMALQGAGYVGQRWLGERRGLALAGLASGFASSTATIAALGTRARGKAGMRSAAVAAALFSTMATFLQFAVVIAAVHPPALARLAVALACGLAATVLAAIPFYLKARDHGGGAGRKGRAFSLIQAVAFALGLAVLSALVAFANERLGAAGAQGGAALAGFLDAHAAGIAALTLAAEDRMSVDAAALACLLGISTNTASKIAAAFAFGGGAYGLRVSLGLIAALAAAWAGLLASG